MVALHNIRFAEDVTPAAASDDGARAIEAEEFLTG